ncbi:MAG: DUF2528 family protein [Rheinheimera sp.]|nr:DUF2528 family protein [Rheinheimera sp.]
MRNNVKTYRVKEDWKDYEVWLEVDHDVLTPELAELINNFWNGGKERVKAEQGSVIKAVIRFAGYIVINEMLAQGGASFRKSSTAAIKLWSDWLAEQEGWPELGIRVVYGEVETTDFDSVELSEVSA